MEPSYDKKLEMFHTRVTTVFDIIGFTSDGDVIYIPTRQQGAASLSVRNIFVSKISFAFYIPVATFRDEEAPWKYTVAPYDFDSSRRTSHHDQDKLFNAKDGEWDVANY